MKNERRPVGDERDERDKRDDPESLEAQAREAVEKSAAELRKQRVPIETEPPTVYRP